MSQHITPYTFPNYPPTQTPPPPPKTPPRGSPKNRFSPVFDEGDPWNHPFTIGELIDILSEFDRDLELRFIGANGELFFHRFKSRGENLETMELDDPETYAQIDSLMKQLRGR